jgi:hypothetical protein
MAPGEIDTRLDTSLLSYTARTSITVGLDEENSERRTSGTPTSGAGAGGGDGHAARGRVADDVDLEQHVDEID